MDNPDTQAILDTRHLMNPNEEAKACMKNKDEQVRGRGRVESRYLREINYSYCYKTKSCCSDINATKALPVIEDYKIYVKWKRSDAI